MFGKENNLLRHNMTSTATTASPVLVGGSERMHDVAGGLDHPTSHHHTSRSARARSTKSPIQKLLARMTHIMSPLSTDPCNDLDKDEFTQQQSFEEIIVNPGQRNSFYQFLRSTDIPQGSYLQSFEFLCLCRELREWTGRTSYTRSTTRVKVLRKYIYQTFLREGSPQQLDLSGEMRKTAERSRVFDDIYRFVSSSLVQKGLVRAYTESHYNHSVWEEDEWNLFKSLSLGGPSHHHGGRNRALHFGGSEAASSIASSNSSTFSSSYRNQVIGSGPASDVSALASEIQSIASSKSSSSKSSSGSNASAAFDKFYSQKHAPKKSRSKNVVITPAKLMEELLPKLNVVELEQNLRIQNYGAIDCGPPGADTPTVLRNRGPTAGDSPPTDHHLSTTTQANNATEIREEDEEEGAMSCEETWDNTTKSEVGEIQLAYTFSSDSMCYGKVLPGTSITLRQFKEVVSWASCDDSTRYFFKRQIPGLGEIHNEVTDDLAVLPFWSQNTIVGRVVRGPD